MMRSFHQYQTLLYPRKESSLEGKKEEHRPDNDEPSMGAVEQMQPGDVLRETVEELQGGELLLLDAERPRIND